MTNVKCNLINLNLDSQQIQTKETQEDIFMCQSIYKNNNEDRTREMFQNIFKKQWNTDMLKVSTKHFLRNMKGKEEFENKEKEKQIQ